MSGVFQKALQLVIGTEPIIKPMPSSPHSVNIMPKKLTHRKLTERELIQRESEIGSMIFGEPPRGCQRDFFNLDHSTWIWHEENFDHATRQKTSTTVRYEVHKNGILKVQEGARYSFLEGDELENFLAAVKTYHERVVQNLYTL